ncbi:MAG: HD domain-containing protein [Bacteroidota bacterium]|nr:HD domain-containing protein [Bacteroidota bacterium]MDP4215407.1 HD domain-containing protein [Bacteroidota bacterium]MDP4254385.1 HD domain-containing protein [Bacteroidota bacterium]MDP4256750.1 HD domain-containing protein [Bacteroidota bacterium]
MPFPSRKIINDPVHGFITLDHPLLLAIIAHPYYQRLRRIHQMAFAHLVYPGAVHTRLHHSLGSYHLMCNALSELKGKGVHIEPEEELGAKVAILLHDAGHGPFSHALEEILIRGVEHEKISIRILHVLNKEFGGQLEQAIRIFTNDHPKPFLHQLISGQLDMDRLDYLARDSFFTGVSEGVIAHDRILKMLTVHKGQLMVEEKAIYSIEKFLVSRRLMYWQVYLHKTVLSAEKMLVRIIERAKELIRNGMAAPASSPTLDFFLQDHDSPFLIEDHLDKFCLLDDFDVMGTIKNWMTHPDIVLSHLCRFLIDRRLLKVRFQSNPFAEKDVTILKEELAGHLRITREEAGYFVFTGQAQNTTYDPSDERINILFKDGSIKDISEVDNALIHQTLASPVKKFYICYMTTST